MRFLHIGDLHLGRSLGEFDLSDDQRYILDEIILIIKEKHVDGVLIAGDVYDKSVPSESATNLLDYFLSELSKTGVKTFMISGNHDSDDRLNFGSKLFEANNVFISSVYDGTLHKYVMEDEHGELAVYLLPFIKSSQVQRFFNQKDKAKEIKNYEDAVRTVIDDADIDTAGRNIIVAHQFVTGRSKDPELGGSESLGTQAVGLVEKVGYDCFDAFDYAALGHIHSAQRVGRNEVRYSGSILKYSLSEANNEKSVTIVDIGKKGETSIEAVQLKPMRDLRHIKGTIRQLYDNVSEDGKNDFIYATLTDEDFVENAMGTLQKIYPYTVKIDYDNSHSKAIEKESVNLSDTIKPFKELMSDFYEKIYGCKMSEEEREYFMQAAKEVGIIDETD